MPYFACATCQRDSYTAVSYLHATACPVCEAPLAAAKDPHLVGVETGSSGRRGAGRGGRAAGADVRILAAGDPCAEDRRDADRDILVGDALRHGLRRRQRLARGELDHLRSLSRRLGTLEADDDRSSAREMLDRLVSSSEQDSALLSKLLEHIGPPRLRVSPLAASDDGRARRLMTAVTAELTTRRRSSHARSAP